MKNKLNHQNLAALGFTQGRVLALILGLVSRHRKKVAIDVVCEELKQVKADPGAYLTDPVWEKLALELMPEVEVRPELLKLREVAVAFSDFGGMDVDPEARNQMYQALKLPISVRGALMPDAHVGYGLPIGGVLAAENAVIPYGVGVDIGCRMKLTVFDMPGTYFKGRENQLLEILKANTKFGHKELHDRVKDAEVLNDKAFDEIPLLKSLHKQAWRQMGTSGGGNHFVEMGTLNVTAEDGLNGVPAGQYFALLSHSGSRALGASIAGHYTQVAKKMCRLPGNMQHLAWLSLDTEPGQEYWRAMQVAGAYAAACHDDIHRRLNNAIGGRMLASVSNHHNFAWKERHDGVELIVHRKGATPAAEGELGFIPGSMTLPGFLVRGKGNDSSLRSAAHGAGRRYSRTECKQKFTLSEMQAELKDHGVSLIGGGVDEAPMAYKNIHQVMALQSDLVEVLAEFHPRLVRMDKG